MVTDQDTCVLLALGNIHLEHWPDGAPLVRSLMQTPMWLAASAEIYGAGDATSVMIVGTAAEPRALALLGLRPTGGYRLLGGIDTGESVEVLAADEAAFERLVRGLVGLGRIIDFGHYPAPSGLGERLRQQAGWRGIVLRRALMHQAMPVLRLDDGWRQPLDRFSSSRRQSLRRKRRKAERLGSIDVQVLAPAPPEVDGLIDRFTRIEARSWKGLAGTSLSQDAKQMAFFHAFGRRMAARGELRLCFLGIDGRDAAAEIAAVWNNRFWSLKLGYDEAFSAVSPGELLRIDLVAQAVEHGLETYEFCGKDAAWTSAWTQEATPIEALRYYPLGPRGLSGLARDTVGLAIRRLRSQ